MLVHCSLVHALAQLGPEEDSLLLGLVSPPFETVPIAQAPSRSPAAGNWRAPRVLAPGFSKLPGSLLWTWELSPDYICSSRLLAPGEAVWKFWHRSLPYSYRPCNPKDLGFGEIFLGGLSRGCPSWKDICVYLILVGLPRGCPTWKAICMHLNGSLVLEELVNEVLSCVL